MPGYKYILLDWDGCLAKTHDLWLQVYKKILKERNLAIPEDREIIKRSFGLWVKGLENLGVLDSEVAFDHAWKEVEKRYSGVELYNGVLDLLENLKKRDKKLGLLTSSIRKVVADALDRRHLKKYFDAFVARDDVKNGKPDPEQIYKSLEILGGKKDEALIMGDSYHDIRAGKSAGVTTVCYYPKDNFKFYTKDDIEKEKPDFVISDLLELVRIVDREAE